MSIKRVAFHSVAIANNQLGGANKTKSMRTRCGRDFIEFCFATGRPISDVSQVSVEALTEWITALRNSGVKLPTLNNKVACLRSLVKARGIDLIKTGLADSKGLGLETRDRAGTKLPVSDEVFDSALNHSLAINEVGFAHILKLERYLGVRGLEAIMATHQLKIFARDALYLLNNDLQEVHVVDGTKGGRPRFVQPLKAFAQQTIDAIWEAVNFAKNNGGYLLEGPPGTGLKGARARYHRLAAKVGLKGKFSPHSLRYRYAVDKLLELCDEGMPTKEALSAVSAALGHGLSRTTFVRIVYCASVVGNMPCTTSAQDFDSLLKSLTAMRKPR